MIFPEAAKPEFVGQGGWRYNFTRPPDLDCIRSFAGPIGIGLVPIAHDSMYSVRDHTRARPIPTFRAGVSPRSCVTG